MGLTLWIDRRLAGGSIFKRYFVPVLRGTRPLSLAFQWNIYVERKVGIPGTKGREWVSELYALIAVVVPFVCLLLVPSFPGWGRALVVVICLYVAIEIALFSQPV